MTKLTRVADFPSKVSPSKAPPVSFVDSVNITGVRQVFGIGSPFLRRLVWLCLMLGMAALLVYQIYSRMTFYLTRPTAQTSSSVYYPSLTFPAVTICNQNFVRMDQSMLYTDIEPSADIPPERHTLLYELLSEYFLLINEPVVDVEYIRNGSDVFTASIFENVSFYDVYHSSAHQQESMIKRCTFNGRKCEPGWFETVPTDAGRCYRFNPNMTDPLKTALYGKNGGLHLELNVEQYLYTRSQAPSAGVYVLIQDQAEIPNLVLNTALRIGAGFYTDIALRTINRTSHGREFGKCGETELSQFPADQPYTRSACELDCLTRYIKAKCGCLHYFMPRRSDSDNTDESCGISELVNCVYIQTNIFPTIENYTDYCSCMTPCHVRNYHASLSQVEFSALATSLFVTGDKLDDVFEEYFAGMLLRDWALVLESDVENADDLHEIVYKFGTARQHFLEATYQFTQFTATLNLSVCDDNSLSDLMSKIHLSVQNFPSTLEITVWEIFLLPVIELSAGLAHNLLNSVPFNQTIYAAIRDVCSDVETTVGLIESEFLLACAVPLQICDIDPREMICVVLSQIREYRQIVQGACAEMAASESLYAELYGYLKKDVGTWYKPWNSVRLDEQFYRENYGVVDIFFQEMSVTEIKESAAYGPIAFFCDLGGSLGLCLGGSLLTLFECMDFIFLKLQCRCFSK